MRFPALFGPRAALLPLLLTATTALAMEGYRMDHSLMLRGHAYTIQDAKVVIVPTNAPATVVATYTAPAVIANLDPETRCVNQTGGGIVCNDILTVAHASGVVFLNVDTPSQPRVVGTIAMPAGHQVWSAESRGTRTYVSEYGDDGNGVVRTFLRIYEAYRLSAPVLRYSGVLQCSRIVALDATHILVGTDPAAIYDVTDAAAPRLLAPLTSRYFSHAVFDETIDRLYLTYADNGATYIDIWNLASLGSPQLLSRRSASWPCIGEAPSLTVAKVTTGNGSGTFLYMGTTIHPVDYQVATIDVTDPQNPSWTGMTTLTSPMGSIVPWDLEVIGTTLHVYGWYWDLGIQGYRYYMGELTLQYPWQPMMSETTEIPR